MKAVIYARYSSDNQREESIEGQLRECKEYAQRNGILVLQSYIDRALSAKTDNRPEFQRMIRDSAKGLFDTVLVWKLDRFARNRYDSAHYKSQLRKNGVKVISATESIADGPEGIILESMLEGMAEYYSAELAQKVNRGMRENALKARSNGGTIPLGYRLDEEHRLKIDPLTAPVVREVFQRYADGENLRTIIRSLNERGIRTSRNYPFQHSSFNTMLKNRKYIGEYHYKDVVIPDAVPPIIPKELFERVQERMKKNQHAPARAKAEEEYLLTTKLFCGHCGRLMIGESGKGRNGVVHRYYKCAGAKRRLGCHKKAVKKDWIERVAVQYTIQRVFQDDLIAQIADELVALQGAEDSALPLLRRQLADTERGIENIQLDGKQLAGNVPPSLPAGLQQVFGTHGVDAGHVQEGAGLLYHTAAAQNVLHLRLPEHVGVVDHAGEPEAAGVHDVRRERRRLPRRLRLVAVRVHHQPQVMGASGDGVAEPGQDPRPHGVAPHIHNVDPAALHKERLQFAAERRQILPPVVAPAAGYNVDPPLFQHIRLLAGPEIRVYDVQVGKRHLTPCFSFLERVIHGKFGFAAAIVPHDNVRIRRLIPLPVCNFEI